MNKIQNYSVHILLFKSIESTEFQILVTFYDAANNWFFGSTWKGPLVPANDIIGGKAKVTLNEPLYFHSCMNDYTVALIIEVAIAEDKVYQSIGWSILRIFANVDKLPDTRDYSQVAQKRCCCNSKYFRSFLSLLLSTGTPP